jgi:hypothetical protein
MLGGVHLAALGLERTADRAARLEVHRNIEALLERALGSVFASPLVAAAPALIGTSQTLNFLTIGADDVGLYRVELGIDAQGGDRRLVLTRRRFDGTAAPTRAVLAPAVRDLRIDYFGAPTPDAAPQWQERWDGTRNPPELVRIALDLGDGVVRPPLVVRLWSAAD